MGNIYNERAIANNIEFAGGKRTATIVGEMFITVDRDNNLIFASNIEDACINPHSQGILKEINSPMAKKIEDNLGIRIGDYGVDILDESFEMEENPF